MKVKTKMVRMFFLEEEQTVQAKVIQVFRISRRTGFTSFFDAYSKHQCLHTCKSYIFMIVLPFY